MDTTNTDDMIEIETIVTYASPFEEQAMCYIRVPYKNRTFEQVIYGFLLTLLITHEDNGINTETIWKLSTCANWAKWKEFNQTQLPQSFGNGKFVFNAGSDISDLVSKLEKLI
jgi:hypothetical protein